MTGTPITSILLVLIASVIGSMGAVYLKLGAEPLRYGWRACPQLQAGGGRGVVPRILGFLPAGNPSAANYRCCFPWSRSVTFWALSGRACSLTSRFTRAKFLGLALILIGVVFVGLGQAVAIGLIPLDPAPGTPGCAGCSDFSRSAVGPKKITVPSYRNTTRSATLYIRSRSCVTTTAVSFNSRLSRSIIRPGDRT